MIKPNLASPSEVAAFHDGYMTAVQLLRGAAALERNVHPDQVKAVLASRDILSKVADLLETVLTAPDEESV